MLDTRRTEGRHHPEPSLRNERGERSQGQESGFGRAPFVIHDDRSFEPLACESEMDWFDSPARRWEARIQRLAVPAVAALAVLLGTGALAAYLFAPTEEPAAAMAESPGAAVAEADPASETTSLALAPPAASAGQAGHRGASAATAEAGPASEATTLALATPAASAGQRGVRAAPADDASSDAGAASLATTRVTPEGGVTVLQRRDAAPAPARPTAEQETQASATRFAPLNSDDAADRIPVPPQMITLPPPQLPTAVRANEPRPAAFAPPPPAAAAVEPEVEEAGTEAVAEEPATSTDEPAAVEPELAAAEPEATPEATSVEPGVAGAAGPASKPTGAAAGTARQPTATARVTTAVNMRAGPNNADPVITVVPAEAQVGVVECNLWCEVVFDGQRGWIYKSFVSQPAAPAGSG